MSWMWAEPTNRLRATWNKSGRENARQCVHTRFFLNKCLLLLARSMGIRLQLIPSFKAGSHWLLGTLSFAWEGLIGSLSAEASSFLTRKETPSAFWILRYCSVDTGRGNYPASPCGSQSSNSPLYPWVGQPMCAATSSHCYSLLCKVIFSFFMCLTVRPRVLKSKITFLEWGVLSCSTQRPILPETLSYSEF